MEAVKTGHTKEYEKSSEEFMELAEKGDPLSSVLFSPFSMPQPRNSIFYSKREKLGIGKMQN